MTKIKPILGIDAHRATDGQKTGTEHYSFQIIKQLLELNKDFKIRLYSDKAIDCFTGEFETKVMPFPKFWSQFRLSVEQLLKKPDLLFVPAHTIPIVHPNTIVTLHDLGFKYFPELYDKSELWYHNWSMNYAAKHASHIISVSEYTKKDLIKNYKIPASRITVIYHGWDRSLYRPTKTGERLLHKKKYGRYLYYIGRLERKKNYLDLLKSFNELKETFANLKLVVSGKPGVGYEETRDYLATISPKVRKDIIELGYTEDKVAAELMREATAFIFPSQFEGFGLPLIEAMASGTPVIATDNTSITEIVADNGVLVKSAKVGDLVPAITNVLNSESLRTRLIRKGLKRADDFSWEKAGRETYEVLLKASYEQ